MNITVRSDRAGASFAQLFTPKLVTVWREGYGLSDLRADAVAGLTFAIVALPLSMAIAVACGLTPDRGLYTAIVGGFLISLLGGSRFQIGGPAGAFIVLIASIVQRHGYDGLALATILAGLILLAIGFFQLGTYIKYIPYPVTVGFTAGIAVIILASQIKELLGLNLAQEPAELVPKLIAIAATITTAKFMTVAIALLSLAIMIGLHILRPTWPAFLIAIAYTAALCAWFNFDVATVGSRFGGVANTLPIPSLPELSIAKIQAVLPDAIAIALLGAIESLLSAVVADGMTGRRHRSNCELVAQGAANIGAAVFGGFCVTGTIARTATNVRASARGPMSGIFHSLYLLLFMLIAAPLVSFIPLASLAAVLVIVAVNMADRREFWSLMRTSRGDALVLLATFFLTITYDLTTAIGVGVVLGSFLFLHRMEQAVEVEAGTSVKLVTDDQSDTVSARTRYDAKTATDRDLVVFRISGAFFFGATARIGGLLDRIGEHPRAVILDFSDVPLIDTTAAKMLRGFVQNMRRSGTIVYFTGTRRSVRRVLLTSGPKRTEVRYMESIETAKQAASNAQHLKHEG